MKPILEMTKFELTAYIQSALEEQKSMLCYLEERQSLFTVIMLMSHTIWIW
jgi:hypothetical protein